MVRLRNERRIEIGDVDVSASPWEIRPSGRDGDVARQVLVRHGIRPVREVIVPPFADVESTVSATIDDIGSARSVPVGAEDVAVVICSRNRADLLAGCLQAVALLDPAPSEVVVVDNGTPDGSTQDVARRFGIRCVVERRAGLDRARNRGIAETTARIVAFLDDDTRPATWWAGAVQSAFDDSAVGAASGLVLAGELESSSQRAFERHAGMRKGYVVRTFGLDAEPIGFEPQVAGIGANMAFRRSVLETVGGFDVALDLGTPTSGGGDLDMLFRVHRSGSHILYDPAIFVRHLHRFDWSGLRRQLTNYGVGYRAFLEKHALAVPEQRTAVNRHLRRWRMRRHVRGFVAAFVRLDAYRVLLAVCEAWGSRRGASAYHRSIAAERRDVERRASPGVRSASTDEGERSSRSPSALRPRSGPNR